MERHFITYKNSRVHYCRFGNGSRFLFCFHGYGEEGKSFYFLESLGQTYTVIALDFPFHGSTEWREGLLFTPDDLLEILFLITADRRQSFGLLGFSMGGRVALHLLQKIPGQITQVALVAPDGLHHNIWHTLSTQTRIGNRLFAWAMYHPSWLFTVMKWGYRTGLLNKSIFNFVHYYLDNAVSREQLYQRWTTMRQFTTDLPLLRKIIRHEKIPVGMLFGRYDRIIVSYRGKQFQKGLEGLVKMKELDAGHQLLKDKYVAEIAALLHPDS